MTYNAAIVYKPTSMMGQDVGALHGSLDDIGCVHNLVHALSDCPVVYGIFPVFATEFLHGDYCFHVYPWNSIGAEPSFMWGYSLIENRAKLPKCNIKIGERYPGYIFLTDSKTIGRVICLFLWEAFSCKVDIQPEPLLVIMGPWAHAPSQGLKQGPCGNVAKFGFHAVWRNSRSLHFCPDHWHRPTASMLFCSMTTGNLILEPLRHFVISTRQKNMTSKKTWICHFKLDMYIFLNKSNYFNFSLTQSVVFHSGGAFQKGSRPLYTYCQMWMLMAYIYEQLDPRNTPGKLENCIKHSKHTSFRVLGGSSYKQLEIAVILNIQKRTFLALREKLCQKQNVDNSNHGSLSSKRSSKRRGHPIGHMTWAPGLELVYPVVN